jgi:hypothetical protein
MARQMQDSRRAGTREWGGKEGASGMDHDRRQHRRLAIQLPMECTLDRERRREIMRTITSNISTGGLYFELDLLEGVAEPQINDVLQLVLTVPPGAGYSPYQGQISSTGRVVRRAELPPVPVEAAGAERTLRRIGMGVRFQEPLKLAF